MTSLMVLTVFSNKLAEKNLGLTINNFQTIGRNIIKIDYHVLYNSNGTKFCQTKKCELLNSEAGAAGAVMARAAAAAAA